VFPKDLTWKEVSIVFTSDEAVKIKARGIARKVTYLEMDFKDGRKGDRPDSRWGFLLRLAQHGELRLDNSDIDQKTKDGAKTAVKDIRKRLKEFFGIDDDPFHKYRKVKAYKPRFTLRDERYGGSR
jgi:hypothetical protein